MPCAAYQAPLRRSDRSESSAAVTVQPHRPCQCTQSKAHMLQPWCTHTLSDIQFRYHTLPTSPATCTLYTATATSEICLYLGLNLKDASHTLHNFIRATQQKHSKSKYVTQAKSRCQQYCLTANVQRAANRARVCSRCKTLQY